MKRVTRRNMLVGLGLAATGFGCGGMNPFLIPYIFSGGDSKAPAEFPLALHPKKKDVKVVVLVSGKTGGVDPDLAGVDRMLNAELIHVLDQQLKDNDPKVLILKMPKIDEYRTQNPNWRIIGPYDFGKAVADGTDYMIDVEIAQMQLYKPGSRGKWLRGHASINIAAYDLVKPSKDSVYHTTLSFDFPEFGNEIEVESRNDVSEFRMKFITTIANGISAKFADSSPTERMPDSDFRR